ncbi:hypothetical protein KC640_02985 [Candidatus Dojkabacteria bacterium]|uniref:Uncharacterized protein n=1 Tax=Candidatus Dojkabacteria bacterium TaxID=2099670 RepID=A0A955KZR0_9BACT|nr:hypothetical protein [Candidatus Dojkabacteria bacterium]
MTSRKALIAVVSAAVVFGIVVIPVWADSVTTSVTVGNSAPSFTAGPAESPASDGTTPTNVGSDVTFTATGTDSNNEDYYLAICKTNSVTPVNGGAPTCGGGSWCISTATTSASQASCAYTALQGDAESNDWYAFVCDGNSSAADCSSSSQGTGGSGSPFKVNHPPVFNSYSNDTPKNPGQDITWSTDASTLDNDTDTASDTVKLVVCKTAGVSGGDCDGGASDRWCQSSLVASDPSCAYSIPTPTADGAVSAYVYLFDSHNLGATTNQGSSSDYTVNNVAPVVSAVTLNGGSAITLTEGTTTNVVIGATVTDNNACNDGLSVETSLYRSGVGYGTCDTNPEDDDNNCYAVISCSVVGAGNTCTGATDASADYTCTVAVQYFADPTDASTVYPTENWLATVKATDDNAATDNAEVAAGVEMNSLVGYSVTSSIAYGSLGVGQSNDPLDKITTVTATGNVGLDQEVSGTNMTSGPNNILVGYQHYALAGSTAYASGTSLTGTPTEIELNCQKTTSTGAPATANTWWGLSVPVGTIAGSYSGTNTLVAVKGEIVNW